VYAILRSDFRGVGMKEFLYKVKIMHENMEFIGKIVVFIALLLVAVPLMGCFETSFSEPVSTLYESANLESYVTPVLKVTEYDFSCTRYAVDELLGKDIEHCRLHFKIKDLSNADAYMVKVTLAFYNGNQCFEKKYFLVDEILKSHGLEEKLFEEEFEVAGFDSVDVELSWLDESGEIHKKNLSEIGTEGLIW